MNIAFTASNKVTVIESIKICAGLEQGGDGDGNASSGRTGREYDRPARGRNYTGEFTAPMTLAASTLQVNATQSSNDLHRMASIAPSVMTVT